MALEKLGMKDQNNLAHLMSKGDEHNLILFAKRSVHIDGVDYALSEFARAKIEAYQGIGALIRQYSRDAQLWIIALPFLRLDYRWWRSS